MDFFKNESEVLTLGDEDSGTLEIQNRTDRITVGTMDITRDDAGLKNLRSLLELLGQIEAELLAERKSGALPKKIKLTAPAAAGNVFGMPAA